MKLCGPYCYPICDHCAHYQFNGDQAGAYTGDGQCEHPRHPRPRDPADGCDDYECKTA